METVRSRSVLALLANLGELFLSSLLSVGSAAMVRLAHPGLRLGIDSCIGGNDKLWVRGMCCCGQSSFLPGGRYVAPERPA